MSASAIVAAIVCWQNTPASLSFLYVLNSMILQTFGIKLGAMKASGFVDKQLPGHGLSSIWTAIVGLYSPHQVSQMNQPLS